MVINTKLVVYKYSSLVYSKKYESKRNNMNKHEAEVKRMGGDVLVSFIRKEFPGPFSIVARTDEMFVLGNNEKNVKFSRFKLRVMERIFHDQNRRISRK